MANVATARRRAGSDGPEEEEDDGLDDELMQHFGDAKAEFFAPRIEEGSSGQIPLPPRRPAVAERQSSSLAGKDWGAAKLDNGRQANGEPQRKRFKEDSPGTHDAVGERDEEAVEASVNLEFLVSPTGWICRTRGPRADMDFVLLIGSRTAADVRRVA